MIFEKRTRRHRLIARGLLVFIFLGTAFLIAALIAGVFTTPTFLSDPLGAFLKRSAPRHQVEIEPATNEASSATPPVEVAGGAACTPASRLAMRAAFHLKQNLRSAFVTIDDAGSLADYAKHSAHLDVVFPVSFYISDSDGKIAHRKPASDRSPVLAKENLVLPVIANNNDEGEWQPNQLARLIDDDAKADRFIKALKDEVLAMGADGVNVDFEQLSVADRDNFSAWMKRLTESFHADHLLVTVDVPLNDEAFDMEYLGEVVDAVVVMAYDEHYAKGQPGSIAGQAWFEEGIQEIVQRIPPAKLIIALGGYGYDWNLSKNTAPVALTFLEAMMLAGDMGSEIQAAGPVMNPTFTYVDENQEKHTVWFLDAVSAWNQLSIMREHKIRGFSLWRLGMEDPGVWDFLANPEASFNREHLTQVRSEAVVAFSGEGEILNIRSVPQDGRRELTFDGNRVDWCGYKSLPASFSVERSGHSAEKKLALTFDDGPDPDWTPGVLDVLRRHGVPGTFFVVGDQAQKFPDLVRREFDEGHIIGNHTFLHPNLHGVSETRLAGELNATQRVIESITSHGTKLFRAPFDTDTTPTEPAQLLPLQLVCQKGFIIAGGDIDSSDYETSGTDAIIHNVTKSLKPGGPNIIVMHDGGGDRRQTVEALEKLVPMLKKQGYEFVSVADLLGTTRAALMPEITVTENLIVEGSSIFGWLRTAGWKILQALFFITTGISILRILFLGILIARGGRSTRPPDAAFTPPVTVLIPAYNESKVICRTLDGVLHADYADFEILVVDDGSTDDTAEVVRRYAATHPHVKLLSKPNGGKWSALNAGFQASDRPIIVTIDADTIVPSHTICELVAPLADPAVDAVCGNVQVGNVHNILTAFQDVEYVTTQNYDRRAFDALNCISVVPGATGAWRRASVLSAGGYSHETLTEDADLTLTMLERGARIVYAPEARSVTEAPDTRTALFKQRLRWSFGTFQCLWKHRGQFFKGTLGWVALPNLFCFQVIYPLLSPLGDAVFILSMLRGDFSAVFAGYLTFLVMDLIGSLVAFKLDHRRPGTLWVVLVQRFFYRQFMYVVAMKAVLQALRGGRRTWNKLDRKATVAMPAKRKTRPAVVSTGAPPLV